MSNVHPAPRTAVLLAAATLALGGCGLLDRDGDVLPELGADEPSADAPDVDPSDPGTDPGADPGSDAGGAGIEVAEAPPRIVPPGAEVAVTLRTPAAGEGPWPRLAWDPVPDATSYTVTLYAASGRALWTWQGPGTEVLVGGFAERPAPGSPVGPRVGPDMSWDVLAHAADGRVVAVSRERPIQP